MSATFLKLVKPLLKSGLASRNSIDAWESRKFLTSAEADEARAYWEEVNTPAADAVTDGGEADTQPSTD